jgi:hypothetical protein
LYESIIEDIRRFYSIYEGRFFVFSNENSPEEVYITYNTINTDKEFTKFPNTISIHRKKQTNTLYTLNAMNQIIRDENEGIFDKTFSVSWELYQNSLVITGEPSIRILPIKLLKIVNT